MKIKNMIGKTVKGVAFDHEGLAITFTCGNIARFGADYDLCSGYLTFEEGEQCKKFQMKF